MIKFQRKLREWARFFDDATGYNPDAFSTAPVAPVGVVNVAESDVVTAWANTTSTINSNIFWNYNDGRDSVVNLGADVNGVPDGRIWRIAYASAMCTDGATALVAKIRFSPTLLPDGAVGFATSYVNDPTLAANFDQLPLEKLPGTVLPFGGILWQWRPGAGSVVAQYTLIAQGYLRGSLVGF